MKMSSSSLVSRDAVVELENKLHKFRVKELIDLLEFANMDTSGLKQELLRKAFILVRDHDFCDVKNFDVLCKKIDELLKRTKIPLRKLDLVPDDHLGKHLLFTNIETLLPPCSFNVEKGAHCVELNIPQSLSRKLKRSQQPDGTYELEIQIKFWETLGVDEWEDAYISIQINNKAIYVPQPSPHVFYVTKYCNFDKNVINTILINSSRPANMLGYHFDVSLVRKHTPLEFLKMFPVKISSDISINALVSNRIRDKSLIRSYPLLLICPKTKKAMTFPCRSSNCSHPEVFDLLSFLAEMQYFLKWKCPVCKKTVTYDSIYVDQTLQKFADSGKLHFTIYKPRESRFFDQESEDVIIAEELVEIND